MKRLSCLLFLLTLCLLATACTPTKQHQVQSARPAIDTTEASIWMIMKKAEQSLATSGRVIPDQSLQQYVKQTTCDTSPAYCNDIRVYVVRQPGFNASMAPNGFMSVWSGLLLRVRNEAQLATILGHEVGHYKRRHSLQRWEETIAVANGMVAFNILTAMAGVGMASNLTNLAAVGYLLM